ncbi:MAG: questin oxidase family protein, partial [Pyrinomonadaceae bacterium]
VTGPSAVRLLLPHLSPEATRSLLRHGWQAAAAFYATFGHAPPAAGPFEVKELNREDLIDRSLAATDEHAIKFTEACLREYALNPRPAYLLAARHAAERLKI